MTNPVPRLSRRQLLQRALALSATGVLAASLPACSDDDGGSDGGSGGSGSGGSGGGGGGGGDETRAMFLGRIEGLGGLVAFDVDAPRSGGSVVRAYACTGTLEDAGGFALWFKGTLGDGAAGLTAVGSTSKLVFSLAGDVVSGTVTLGDGRSGAFHADAKSDGSGVYDITVGSDLSYKGKSTRGEVLDGEISKATDGSLQFAGTITRLDGAKVPVEGVADKVDTYIAVGLVEGGKLRQAGRSGDVRLGKPGLNVIDGTSNTLRRPRWRSRRAGGGGCGQGRGRGRAEVLRPSS